MRTIRRRKRLIAVLFILVIVGLGPYVASRIQSASRRIRVGHSKTTATANKATNVGRSMLRIATYNIAHGRGATDGNWEEIGSEKQKRIQQIARLIDEANVDIVVLNEVDFIATWSGHQNQAEAIARLAGFPHWVEQRNMDFRFLYGSWKFGNAILSQYPIDNVQSVEFPPYKNWEDRLAGHKRGVVCAFRISPDRRIRVLAVHLEHRSEDVRVASARKIVELAGSTDIPLIAAGDFNSTPIDFPRAERTATGQNAMAVLADSGQFKMRRRVSPGPEDMTFPSNQPSQVIDWILIPGEWDFATYRVVDSGLSDHRPVIAEVKLNGTREANRE